MKTRALLCPTENIIPGPLNACIGINIQWAVLLWLKNLNLPWSDVTEGQIRAYMDYLQSQYQAKADPITDLKVAFKNEVHWNIKDDPMTRVLGVTT